MIAQFILFTGPYLNFPPWCRNFVFSSTFTSSPVLRVLSEGSGAETIHPKTSGLFQSLIYVSQQSILF